MVLYLGKNKLKLNLNGVSHRLSIISNPTVKVVSRLISKDGFILKDSSGLYLIHKEDN